VQGLRQARRWRAAGLSTGAKRVLLILIHSARVAVAAFALRVVSTAAIAISRAVSAASIAIGFRDFTALRPDQKLFPHFGEARTTVFAVEQVQYGGHDRAPSFDIAACRVTTPSAAKA
jgi:hypothetical protein